MPLSIPDDPLAQPDKQPASKAETVALGRVTAGARRSSDLPTSADWHLNRRREERDRTPLLRYVNFKCGPSVCSLRSTCR